MRRFYNQRLRGTEKACLFGLIAFPVLIGSGCRTPNAVSPPSSPPSTTPGNALPSQSAAETRARLAAQAELAPEDPNAALRLALFDRDHDAVSQAEQELKAIHAHFPTSAEASYQLGSLYLNLGHPEEAAAPLLAAAAREQGRAEIQVMAALTCFRLDRSAEAERYARAALKVDSNNAAAYLLLARVYSSHGTAAQSQAAIQEYLKRASAPAPGYYLLARMYYRQADAANAERALQRALQSDPENGDYWALLGHIYGDLNNGARLAEAITAYKKALALKPHDSEVHASLGRALMRGQHWEEAAGELRLAMQSAPDPGPLLYSLGHSLLRAGHSDEGRSALNQYQSYQEYIRSSARLKGAIKANPQDRESRYALVRLCLRYRQYGAARATLNAAAPLCSTETAWQKLNNEVETALSKQDAREPR
jgi:predicted Zn-dependent protease